MRQFLFFILFCLSTASYCQHTPLYQLRFYTTENGLPSNGIKGLEWDEKSKFLWIGTEAGIVRFNGIDFKVFSKANLPGSNLERVANMVRNDENKIYAFDLENKIYTVTNHNITFSTIENNAILSRINKAIAPALFDKKITEDILEISKKFTLYHLAKIVTTQNGDCYILDELKKLHRFPSSKSNTAYSVMTNQFKNLFKVADKNILLSKDNSFHLINDSLTFNTTTITLEHTNGQKFNITPKHKIYWSNGMSNPILVFENNAWLLSFENNCIKAKIICTQVPTNSLILFIQYDLATKTLFIGTESKGIIIISENKVQSIKNKIASNNSRNAYYSQVKLDTTIILTNEGHTITKSKGSSISNPFKEVFGYRTSLTSDSVFWVTTKASDKKGNNLFSYNSNTRQVKEYRNIKNINFANICKLNNTYYITTALGIGKIIADSVFYLHKYASPLHVSNEPFDLTQHNNTSLLYATCKNIIQYNIESNTLDTLFTSNDYCIRTLHKYNDYYFAGTYGGGYFIYKKGVTKPMPLDKNNFLLHTHCFVIDAKGYCWLSTNRGLFKAKLDDIINAYEKNSAFVYYHYLGKNDGMEITELNGGCSPCALQLNANTISFPSMDGLLWTNPNSENLQLPDGNVYIDNFIINDKTFFSTDTSSIRLPQNTKSITIQLAYTAWCNKENIYIYYRLNKNDEWIPLEANAENSIRLSNLPAGSYQLEIKKVNGFGINNTSYKTLAFTIAMPWYKKWWFFVLLAIILLSIFYAIYKVRTRNLVRKQLKLEKLVTKKTIELQEKNSELEKNNTINNRLISIISHDIVTPLKFLNVTGKNLLEKKALMSEELKDEMVKEITTTSKELQLLSTNILNWIKYQNENRRLVKEEFNVNELVTQVFGVLQSLAHQKNIMLINTIDSNLVITQYHEPLKILIYNLVTNAINFSDKGNITVSNFNKDGNTIITVSDEGVGMTAEQINNIMADQIIVSSANIDNKKGHGLGYLIIKDLLKMMDAKIMIESTKNKGTIVSLRF